MRPLLWFLVLFLMAVAPAAAQVVQPTADSLRAITERGRLLAAYDTAAWRATDAVLALRPTDEEVRGYVALKEGGRWRVVFGRTSDDGQAFLTAFEALQSATSPGTFDVVHHSAARRDTGVAARAARALDAARADFGGRSRPYNAAVLPTGSGDWYVYLIPAQTEANVFPLGADVRYRVSQDGRRIVAKRPLHNSVLEFGGARAPAGALEAGVHSAVLDNVPEDTDVFHVLVRRPRVPQYIVTDAFVYRVEATGAIALLGRRQDVLGPDGKLRQ